MQLIPSTHLNLDGQRGGNPAGDRGCWFRFWDPLWNLRLLAFCSVCLCMFMYAIFRCVQTTNEKDILEWLHPNKGWKKIPWNRLGGFQCSIEIFVSNAESLLCNGTGYFHVWIRSARCQRDPTLRIRMACAGCRNIAEWSQVPICRWPLDPKQRIVKS